MLNMPTAASHGLAGRSLVTVAAMLAMVFLSLPIVQADPLISPFTGPALQDNGLRDNGSQKSAGDERPAIGAALADPMETLMQSIVSVRTTVPDLARTASNFGTSRKGSGVVLDTSGLIVTAGYTIAEADSVSITFSDGREVDAEIIAYDEATGLGLVRAGEVTVTTPIRLGKSSGLKKNQLVMIIPAGGEPDAKGVKIGKIEKFTGGWEYMVQDAIHTYPPSTNFTGAALVSDNAELLGIGALVTIDIDIDPKIRVPGNVFVPIDSLTSVLGELILNGRSQASRKPWLGLDTKKTKKGIMVSSVIEDGPAQKSGIKAGDVIVAVDQGKVTGQAEMYEKIWTVYKPGDQVHLLIVRDNQYANVPVDSIDYYDWLRLDQHSDTMISEMTE